MKQLKILQVNKFYYPVTGGVERVVQQLAEGLSRSTDTIVLTCQKKGTGKTETINGVTVRRCHSFGVKFSMPLSLSFFGELRRWGKDCDILHLHMPFPLGDLALLLSGYHGKVVLWWHSDIVKQKKLLMLYRPLLDWTLRRADAIIVATEGHILGSDFLPLYRDKCHIIPFGVEPVIMERTATFLAETPVPNQNDLAFLFVGRFVYYKGCDILIQAFAKSGIKNTTLTMVGEGPLSDELYTLAERLGVADRIIWKSGLSDTALAEEFAACDVFILPSVAKSEAFGLVQIEAMAYAKPVINTRLPSGVPYVSLDGVTGLTVNPTDVAALAKAMKWMADHPEQRHRMGQAARKRVEEEYTMASMLERTMQLYQSLTK